MLRNGKGFMLPEILLSFSIWIMIALFLIPAYIHLLKQIEQIDRDLTAYQLLFEYLQEVRMNINQQEDKVLMKKGVEYELIWINEKEVCLDFEDVFDQKRQICEIY